MAETRMGGGVVDELAPFVLQKVEKLEEEKREEQCGSYGFVYKVKVGDVVRVAKKPHSSLIQRVSVQERSFVIANFRKECLLLSKLRHPNVVKFIGVHYGWEGKDDLALIMERLASDLMGFLSDNPDVGLSTKISILQDVSYGLVYLHEHNPPIVHRDLTTRNVLLTNEHRAKIADVGVSKMMSLQEMYATSHTQIPGQICYMPPEARIENSSCTPKLDIFSFGHLSLHTVLGDYPNVYDIPRSRQLNGVVEQQKRQRSLDKVGSRHCLYPIIIGCLMDDPENRPTTQQLNDSLTLLVVSSDRVKNSTECSGGLKLCSSGSLCAGGSGIQQGGDGKEVLPRYSPYAIPWTCTNCHISNESVSSKCAHCQSPLKPLIKNISSTSRFQKVTSPLAASLAPLSGSWVCEACLVGNYGGDNKCVACSSPKPLQRNTSSLALGNSGGLELGTNFCKFNTKALSRAFDNQLLHSLTEPFNFSTVTSNTTKPLGLPAVTSNTTKPFNFSTVTSTTTKPLGLPAVTSTTTKPFNFSTVTSTTTKPLGLPAVTFTTTKPFNFSTITSNTTKPLGLPAVTSTTTKPFNFSTVTSTTAKPLVLPAVTFPTTKPFNFSTVTSTTTKPLGLPAVTFTTTKPFNFSTITSNTTKPLGLPAVTSTTTKPFNFSTVTSTTAKPLVLPTVTFTTTKPFNFSTVTSTTAKPLGLPAVTSTTTKPFNFSTVTSTTTKPLGLPAVTFTTTKPFNFSTVTSTTAKPLGLPAVTSSTTKPFNFSTVTSTTTKPLGLPAVTSTTTKPLGFPAVTFTTTKPFNFSTVTSTTAKPLGLPAVTFITTKPFNFSTVTSTTTKPLGLPAVTSTTTKPLGLPAVTFTTTKPFNFSTVTSTTTKPLGLPAVTSTTTKPLGLPAVTFITTKPFNFSTVTSTTTKPLGLPAVTSNTTKPFNFSTVTSTTTKPLGLPAVTSNTTKPFNFSTVTSNTTKPLDLSAVTSNTTKPFNFSTVTSNTTKPLGVSGFFSVSSTTTTNLELTHKVGQINVESGMLKFCANKTSSRHLSVTSSVSTSDPRGTNGGTSQCTFVGANILVPPSSAPYVSHFTNSFSAGNLPPSTTVASECFHLVSKAQAYAATLNAQHPTLLNFNPAVSSFIRGPPDKNFISVGSGVSLGVGESGAGAIKVSDSDLKFGGGGIVPGTGVSIDRLGPTFSLIPPTKVSSTSQEDTSSLAGSWVCEACLVRNRGGDDKCVACSSRKPFFTGKANISNLVLGSSGCLELGTKLSEFNSKPLSRASDGVLLHSATQPSVNFSTFSSNTSCAGMSCGNPFIFCCFNSSVPSSTAPSSTSSALSQFTSIFSAGYPLPSTTVSSKLFESQPCSLPLSSSLGGLNTHTIEKGLSISAGTSSASNLQLPTFFTSVTTGSAPPLQNNPPFNCGGSTPFTGGATPFTGGATPFTGGAPPFIGGITCGLDINKCIIKKATRRQKKRIFM